MENEENLNVGSTSSNNDWNWAATKSEFDAAGAFNKAQTDRARVDYDAAYTKDQTGDLREYQYREVSTKYTPYSSINVGRAGSSTSYGYDIIGIKAGKIENMRSEIQTYVNRVQNKLNDCLETNDKELSKAIRGSALESAVNAYINKVKLYCQNVTSDLLAFSDKLADVGNQWIAATSKMAGDIGTGTTNYAAGSTYQSSIKYNGATSSSSSTSSTSGSGSMGSSASNPNVSTAI